ncbi:hypothetical protein [Williamsia sp. Leaf354]|uniref:hypothetical protein n=1 Tax=Williamsia sp. Leaf354 TaxID=1736349 RepID=UPI0012E3B156|nr:hypothetical protein [Williamsia sp. Leaf354]
MAPVLERTVESLIVSEVIVKREPGEDATTLRQEISGRITPWVDDEADLRLTPRVVLSQREMKPENELMRRRGRDALWRALHEAGVQTQEADRSTTSIPVGGREWMVSVAQLGGVEDLLQVLSIRSDAIGLLAAGKLPSPSGTPIAATRVPGIDQRQGGWVWLRGRVTGDDLVVFPFGEFDDREVGLTFVYRHALFGSRLPVREK